MDATGQADHDQARLEEALMRAYVDNEFRDRLLADPMGTLAEAGVTFPDGVRVTVHEFDMNDRHLFLPPRMEAEEGIGKEGVPVLAVARPFLRPSEGGIQNQEVNGDG